MGATAAIIIAVILLGGLAYLGYTALGGNKSKGGPKGGGRS